MWRKTQMQNYQSYYPFNTNYQPAQQNPYMQRMEYLQQYQQNLQPQVPQPQMSNQLPALGKIVESIDIVKATDIPMDGNMYYFPKADGSEIYAKQWLANGTSQILSFKPVLNDSQGNVQDKQEMPKMGLSDDLVMAFMQRFDDLTDRFDKLEKSIKPSGRSRKEVSDE